MAEFSKPDDLSIVWASAGQKRQPNESKIELGFIKEIPKFQDVNWILGRQDEAMAHFNQFGIPQWDATTEYRINKSYVQGSDGNIYIAKTTHTNINPITDTDFSDWGLILARSKLILPEITVTLSNSFTQHTITYPALKAAVVNGVLYLNGEILSPTPVTNNTFATLPVGYRPSATKVITAYKSVDAITTFTPVGVKITSAGACSYYPPTNGEIVTISGAIVL